MLRNTSVVCISLPPIAMRILTQITQKTTKTRSEIIKEMIVSYSQNKAWEQIFDWGRQTKEKYNLSSEEDILRLIND